MAQSEKANLKPLVDAVIAFRDARDWKQFHNAKDVAISLSLESMELLELFQWAPSAGDAAHVAEKKEAIADEMADVFYWLLLMSHDWDIDLGDALRAKLTKNELKYPLERSRGSSQKYDKS